MKNLTLILGLICLLLGFYLFSHPLFALAWIGRLLGVIVLIIGLRGLLRTSALKAQAWSVIQSILFFLLGLVLLSSSLFSITAFVVTLLAYFATFLGALGLVNAFLLKKTIHFKQNKPLLSALLMLILGLVFLSQPILSSAIIGKFLSLLLIFSGIGILYTSYKLPY